LAFSSPKHISRDNHAISFHWSMSLGNSLQAHSKRHSGKSNMARRSTSTAPMPVQELSKLVLAFWEESLKISFEYARKLALTSSLQEAANVQAELVKRQIDSAQRHIQELARATAAKDQT
jgi:hypothetical protein